MGSGLAGRVMKAEKTSFPLMRWAKWTSATAHAPAAKRHMRRQR
jgi:hypothetical protein